MERQAHVFGIKKFDVKSLGCAGITEQMSPQNSETWNDKLENDRVKPTMPKHLSKTKEETFLSE